MVVLVAWLKEQSLCTQVERQGDLAKVLEVADLSNWRERNTSAFALRSAHRCRSFATSRRRCPGNAAVEIGAISFLVACRDEAHAFPSAGTA
jgi:hypothetical protein